MNKFGQKIAVTACFFFVSFGSLHAASPCYSVDDAEADAALRYHAQLRVTGLSCSAARYGQPMFPVYQTFTSNNSAMLQSYQDKLLDFYRQNYSGDPQARFYTRETELENEESLAAAKHGIAAFCNEHVPELQHMASAPAGEVKQRIAAFMQASASPVKLCPVAPSR